jgi:hypothetical protein
MGQAFSAEYLNQIVDAAADRFVDRFVTGVNSTGLIISGDAPDTSKLESALREHAAAIVSSNKVSANVVNPVNLQTLQKPRPKFDKVMLWLIEHPDKVDLPLRDIADLIGDVSHTLVDEARDQLRRNSGKEV